tara:strand:+ start:303 stop:2240 length:1938 start_codon:yes stop_codon:yes gene_type:complete
LHQHSSREHAARIADWTVDRSVETSVGTGKTTVPSTVNGSANSRDRFLPIVALAVAIALLLVTGLATRNTVRQTLESSGSVEQTYALLRQFDEISLNLAEVINATRGFLFTGLEFFLDPVDQRRQTLDANLRSLDASLAEKPAQLERLAELRVLLERRLALNEEYIQTRRVNDTQTAADAIPPGGELLVQQIRDRLSAMAAFELGLLAQQQETAAIISTRALDMMTLAGVISLLILSFAFLALRRQVIQREQAEDSLHAVEDQLRQSQKMEAIGRLASGVAHDFNNLLTIIRGHCGRLLRQHPGISTVEMSARSIIKTGDRGAALTGQLLAFSRKQALEPDNVDLNAVVRDLLAMVSRTGRDDVELVTDLVDDLPAVRANRGQLDQVVLNLVVNAQDAMPSGGQVTIETGTVRLSLASDLTGSGLPPGSYVRLTVRDSGVGMDTETQSHIFEPFFTTKRDKGTGLGLATVYGILRQSGGHVTVESELEVGTSITVLLPPGDGVEPSAAPQATSALDKHTDTAPPGVETILAVEDDADLRVLTAGWLREHGYTVLEAADGTEALRVAAQHPRPVDALVTDAVMPKMNGRELFEQMSQTMSDIKVLFVSGFANGAMVCEGKLPGDAAFLPKPFSRQSLMREVGRMLE